MTNLFDSFRQRVGEDKSIMDRDAIKFIFDGEMATEVRVGEAHYQAAVVYDNRVEADRAFLYLIKPERFKTGMVFTWSDNNLQDHHFIIYDEEKIVKNVRFNKYLCFECNVLVDDTWGYLIGPGSAYINTQLRQALDEVSLAKPVLIMGSDEYEIATILDIGDRAWRIIEKDNYSHPGLIYYYLEQYVRQKDSDDIADTFDDYDDSDDREDNEVRPGQVITIETDDGYFESDVELQPRITRTGATFTVPYDVETFNVVFKTGELIRTITYKVVM